MNNLPFDESDDAGPTRVLSPQPQDANPSISATRPPRTVAAEASSPARPPATAQADPGTLPDYMATSRPPNNRQKRYDRIQFLPGVLGWLVAYALLGITTSVHSWCIESLGLHAFSTFPEAFSLIVHPHASTPQASLWIWVISSALLYTVCFSVGGYAAARMTVRSPLKQGLGLWLWQILALMIATAVVEATGNSSEATEHLALQQLLGEDLNKTLPGVVVLLFLSLVGSLIGSLFGPPYHRHLNSPQNPPISRETNRD